MSEPHAHRFPLRWLITGGVVASLAIAAVRALIVMPQGPVPEGVPLAVRPFASRGTDTEAAALAARITAELRRVADTLSLLPQATTLGGEVAASAGAVEVVATLTLPPATQPVWREAWRGPSAEMRDVSGRIAAAVATWARQQRPPSP